MLALGSSYRSKTLTFYSTVYIPLIVRKCIIRIQCACFVKTYGKAMINYQVLQGKHFPERNAILAFTCIICHTFYPGETVFFLHVHVLIFT